MFLIIYLVGRKFHTTPWMLWMYTNSMCFQSRPGDLNRVGKVCYPNKCFHDRSQKPAPSAQIIGQLPLDVIVANNQTSCLTALLSSIPHPKHNNQVPAEYLCDINHPQALSLLLKCGVSYGDLKVSHMWIFALYYLCNFRTCNAFIMMSWSLVTNIVVCSTLSLHTKERWWRKDIDVLNSSLTVVSKIFSFMVWMPTMPFINTHLASTGTWTDTMGSLRLQVV